MLLGLLAIAVPVVVHLLNKRTARLVDWGAMRFLLDTLMRRRRRILLEEMLLLACRCLLVALFALALARPFVPEESHVPWAVVLPLALLAITLFAVGFALWRYPQRRRWVWLSAALAAMLAAGAVLAEGWLNLRRLGGGRVRDVALIVDGSTSMTMEVDGRVNFERALDEARAYIDHAPPGTAFSLVLGGATPQAITPAPIADRAQLHRHLDALRPSSGVMDVLDAMAVATLTLAEGHRSAKQIVVIGAGQRVGWRTEQPADWSHARNAFRRFPSPPQLVLRRLPLPAGVRNLTVTDMTFSRQVVGTDREVGVDVVVRNTGTESVTPREVRLSVGDERLTDSFAGQIEPGVETRARFMVRFRKPGSHVVEASIEADDEMSADNAIKRVIHVVDRLPVLIADGSPARDFADRAGGYVKTALAPVPDGNADKHDVPETAVRQDALVDPEWIDSATLPARLSFDQYAMVVLADVPLLPAAVAEKLASFVQEGGGLLVLHGRRSDAEFYNGWVSDAAPMMPFPLRAMAVSETENPMGFDLSSFQHPALTPLRSDTDMARAVVGLYWSLEEGEAAAGTVCARLANGMPWIAEARRGNGRIIQVASPFDMSGGNLVSLRAFVPLIHALTYHLVRPATLDLNRMPATSHTLRFPSALARTRVQETDSSQFGLQAQYFDRPDLRVTAKEKSFSRVDPQIRFDWGNAAPIDGISTNFFSVRWTGSLIPRHTEKYTFFADPQGGSVDVVIAGRTVVKNQGFGQIDLQAHRPYAIRMDYRVANRPAAVRLEWESYSQSRELVPAAAFRVRQVGNYWTDGLRAQVTGPGEQGFEAEYFSIPEGLALKIDHRLAPGLYEAAVPAELATMLAPATSEQGTIPFSVRDDRASSILTPLTEADVAFIADKVDFLVADNRADALRALLGRAFGRELWRLLAVAALLLVVGETVLTRWIAIQRRLGDEGKVEFEPAQKVIQ